jgi:hypothetical protein
MKKIFLSSCFFVFTIIGLQAQTTNVTTYTIETNNLDELKKLDFKGVKGIFSDNNPESDIEIAIKTAFTTKETKNAKGNMTLKVGGKAKNIDALIKKLKKHKSKLIKVITNKN